MNYLFTEVLDGRNARLTDGVQRALGRKPSGLQRVGARCRRLGRGPVSEPGGRHRGRVAPVVNGLFDGWRPVPAPEFGSAWEGYGSRLRSGNVAVTRFVASGSPKAASAAASSVVRVQDLVDESHG